MYGNQPVTQKSVASSAADVAVGTAGGAAVVTYAGNAAARHVITGLAYSYSATPTGAYVTVEDGAGNVVFKKFITDSNGMVVFPLPKAGAAVNTDLIVTLASGGGAIVPTLSVLNHLIER